MTRAVDWFPVHRLVAPILATVESWPAVGTLPWQALTDTDPAKWCAVLDAARYGALRMQLDQEALAEASHDVSNTADWSTIAHHHLCQHAALSSGVYIPRRIAS